MAQYEATILGGLWWPIGAPASTEVTFTADDDEAAANRVYLKAGDFSEVRDFELRRVDTRGHVERDAGGRLVVVNERRLTVVKAWESEETAAAYWDTVGGFDEEEEA